MTLIHSNETLLNILELYLCALIYTIKFLHFGVKIGIEHSMKNCETVLFIKIKGYYRIGIYNKCTA